jgi:DNA polymerase-3 subunit epsilon
MNRILTFIDTETTGLSADNGDKIVEIGAIQMLNGIILDTTFHHYINPQRLIPIEATRIHGITNEKVRNAPLFSHIAEQLMEFIKDTILIAHNAPFDIKFLNHELKLLGMPQLTNDVEDTLRIAKSKFPGASASLDALCKRFNVDLAERTFHGALLDSKLLACVYRKMVINDQSALNFSMERKKSRLIAEKLPTRPIRHNLCQITQNEQTMHEEFSQKYKLWQN